MSSHYTQLDQIALKVNELVRAINILSRNLGPDGCPPVEPLTCAPPHQDPPPPVDYPEYSRTTTDHSTLGS